MRRRRLQNVMAIDWTSNQQAQLSAETVQNRTDLNIATRQNRIPEASERSFTSLNERRTRTYAWHMRASDANKDWTCKDKDKDKDLNLVLKESLRTKTRINITGGFTVLPAHPHVLPQSEWAIPAFAFPAAAGTHLPTPEGWKAE